METILHGFNAASLPVVFAEDGCCVSRLSIPVCRATQVDPIEELAL